MTDFELVVVNDGSTDDTGEILNRYASRDSRVRVIHQTNGGIVAALNAGLAECRGEYIARMDGDDICLPHRFAYQADYLDRHPDCVCVGGRTETIDAEGNRGPITEYNRNRVTSFETFPVRVALTAHPLAMFRADALRKAGGYRIVFPQAEDYDLFLRLALQGTIDNPPETLLHYRNHAQSVSRLNVERQETQSMYAELAMLVQYRGGPNLSGAEQHFEAVRTLIDAQFPGWIRNPYVQFRIWRRLYTLEVKRPPGMLRGVIMSALSLDPRTIFSKDYWSLRVRMLGRLMINAVDSIRR